MRLFRKILFSALIIIFILSVQAYASEIANTVKVRFKTGNIPTLVENNVRFELYDDTGVVNFDTVSHRLKRGQNEFEIEFALPYYPIGTKFFLEIDDGVKGATYEGVYSSRHLLETRTVKDENGEIRNITEFEMELDCYWNKEASIKIENSNKTDYSYRITESDVYVTLDLIKALGIQYEPHLTEDKPYFKLYTDSFHNAVFYIDDIYAVFGSDALNLPEPVYMEDFMPYVPLSRVAVYFACNYNLVADSEYLREITLTPSVYSDKYIKEKAVNSTDISSKTNYMIWVSKKDFEVNIFTGSQNKWTHLITYPCSIGAPGTPTIEGQFEYHQRQPRWNYDKYYCGPVMRFYRGYAFHSYLIRYDGRVYDGRLGMKISLGCVRMHPNDIGWMSENIPLNTKVYITP